ncbi:type IV pilus assembly protein PilM [Candidatus Saccharibacteria bacterium]|nr:type IV pilus assembly protein PilM [Candidatus Saccharibacteria bacterium]
MNLLHGVGDFFSLDIGTNSMRIVQLSGGSQRGWSLQKYAYIPIDQKLTADSSDLGKKRLGEAILGAVDQAGIKTKNIAIGLPASKTFTAIVETETLPEKELRKTFKYELDKYVPMSLNDAKADYVILGPSPNDPAKTEILVSSIAKDYAESTMEMIEKTGLNIVAMEPEPLAMARSLAIPGAIDAIMIVDFGEKSTDLVIVYKNEPRLVRSIPGGFGVLVNAVSGGLNVREDQARQFILKFGLDTQQVEGQVFKVLSTHLDNYASELAKSVRFFQTKYLGGRVGGIVLSGYASMIPLFAEYIEAKTNVPTMKGNPWQSVRTTPAQQQALMPVASEFAVVIGLSERSND